LSHQILAVSLSKGFDTLTALSSLFSDNAQNVSIIQSSLPGNFSIFNGSHHQSDNGKLYLIPVSHRLLEVIG